MEASASQKHTTSLDAARSPAQHAAPKPRRGSCTTSAPWAWATAAVSSVDPLSTTIARYPAGIRVSTHGSASASSSAGNTTSMSPGLAGPWSEACGCTPGDGTGGLSGKADETVNTVPGPGCRGGTGP